MAYIDKTQVSRHDPRHLVNFQLFVGREMSAQPAMVLVEDKRMSKFAADLIKMQLCEVISLDMEAANFSIDEGLTARRHKDKGGDSFKLSFVPTGARKWMSEDIILRTQSRYTAVATLLLIGLPLGPTIIIYLIKLESRLSDKLDDAIRRKKIIWFANDAGRGFWRMGLDKVGGQEFPEGTSDIQGHIGHIVNNPQPK